MKKFCIYIISVILITLSFDLIFTNIYEAKIGIKYDKKIEKSYSPSPEIAIFGASRANHHYVPSILEDSLNLSAFNYGINGQNIFVHFAILKNLINQNSIKPKIVILDLSAIDIIDSYRYNTDKLSILYPYYNDNINIREILIDLIDSSELFFIKYSGLYRHNSQLISQLKGLLSDASKKDKLKGYSPLYKEWDQPIKGSDSNGMSPLPIKIKYLKAFIDLCKQEDIDIFLITSPYYAITGEQEWVTIINEIALEKNVPYIYMEQDSLFKTHPNWFNEPYHLNDKGAHIYTTIISKKLKELRNS